MAGYNDPGHPAGLPSEPSPRRLPAGDGSGATAQMEGLQGPGSLQPGFRQCCFPNLKRGDARCKSTARNRKTKTHGQKRAEREKDRSSGSFFRDICRVSGGAIARTSKTRTSQYGNFQRTVPSRQRFPCLDAASLSGRCFPCGIALERAVGLAVSSANFSATSTC